MRPLPPRAHFAKNYAHVRVNRAGLHVVQAERVVCVIHGSLARAPGAALAGKKSKRFRRAVRPKGRFSNRLT